MGSKKIAMGSAFGAGGAGEVRVCVANSAVPTLVISSGSAPGFSVAAGKALVSNGPLVVDGQGSTSYDVLAAVRAVRTGVPLASGVLDGSYKLPDVGVGKFAAGALPVARGGTGRALAPSDDGRLVIGAGDLPTRTSAGALLGGGGGAYTTSVAGGIRTGTTAGGDLAVVRSTSNAMGGPALLLSRPGRAAGDEVDLVTPRQSLVPVVTSLAAATGAAATAAAGQGRRAFTMDVRAHMPVRAHLAAYLSPQLRTSEEVARGYRAAVYGSNALSGAVSSTDGVSAGTETTVGYPFRRAYSQLPLTAPAAPPGHAWACVVEDAWGNLSAPATVA